MALLIALFFCHYLADYTWLSTNWMLSAKRLGKPLLPIFCHALVHATLMFIVVWFWMSYNIHYWDGITVLEINLFALQLSTHFLIDVWKGKMNVWFPLLQNPANKLHWIVFGFDQLLHAVVIIIMYSILIH